MLILMLILIGGLLVMLVLIINDMNNHVNMDDYVNIIMSTHVHRDRNLVLTAR